ncbi:MAG: response regulator, partial [Pseudomonadota bacterium]|nr:response regulator [Pseudomonadota bacterium]
MKKHIVLIEDEAGIRDNYRAAFERRGYRVSTYGDRPAAWQVLRQSLPDLAIIDVG